MPTQLANPVTAKAKSSPASFPLEKAEWIAALTLTGWLLCLHVVFMVHAGPMWRDEVGSVAFASMPLPQFWHDLHYDNFPPLFELLVHLWRSLGLTSDFSFRILGLLIGLAGTGALWLSARWLGARTPLLLLTLYAINPLAIRVGDSMRAYGLGIAFSMLTMAAMWKMIANDRTDKPANKRLWLGLAILSAVLSVQTLYQCAFFIAVFSFGGWAVVLKRRDWKSAIAIATVAVVSAISLLPYIPTYLKGRPGYAIAHTDVSIGSICKSIGSVWNFAGPWGSWIWGATIIAAAVVFVKVRRASVAYCALVLLLSAVIYITFSKLNGFPPRPRYFLIMTAILAVAVDAILASAATRKLATARIIVASLIGIASAYASFSGLLPRQTNMDYVAARLKQSSTPGDVIVIAPYYFAVSFQHYWPDTNRWTTLPPMEDHRIHRYDLMRKSMETPDSIAPLLMSQIQTALKSGHKLWWVGHFDVLQPGQYIPKLPPFNEKLEWTDSDYLSEWIFQISEILKQHAGNFEPFESVGPKGPVDPDEDMRMYSFSGWTD